MVIGCLPAALDLNIGSITDTLNADERKLKQILYNLLANAVKFTQDGGSVGVWASLVESSEVKLPPQAAADHTCAAVSSGEFIKVVVTDSGIGLNREDLDRIFDPFDQVESSISRRFSGTGLGLSLTKSLVALHGGTIWAESEGLGKGSRFTFIAPVFHKN